MSDMWGICRKIFVPILQTNPMGLVCKSIVSPPKYQNYNLTPERKAPLASPLMGSSPLKSNWRSPRMK